MNRLVLAFTMVGLLVLFGTIGSADLMEGMVLYYTFDEEGDGVVIDRSGNGNDGTIQGGTMRTAGKFGQGLELDGVNTFISVPHDNSMDITNGMTIAAWIKPAAPAVQCWLYYLISKWNYHSGDHRCYFIGLLDGDGMTAFISSDGTDAGTSRLDGGAIKYGTGTWQHVAATYDSSNLNIYINGEEVGALAVKVGLFVDTEEGISIGAGSMGREKAAMFTGVIDEVAIYRRALDDTELRQLIESSIVTGIETTGKLATTWGGIKAEYH